MNGFLNLPLDFRAAICFVCGAFLGGQINRGVYRLAWRPRSIGPWSAPHVDVPNRGRWDRIPIVGWFLLRRESHVHGTGYWVRPALIEIATAFGLVFFYRWTVAGQMIPPVPGLAPAAQINLHACFFALSTLMVLMLVVTFIDIDEKTIPDEITIPGTLLGLCFAFVLPAFGFPIPQRGAPPVVGNLDAASPNDWPAIFNQQFGLVLGLCCFLGWCFALLPKTWYTRRGWIKALQFLAASVFRHPLTKWTAAMGFTGSCCIALAWHFSLVHWPALLSSLLGMAFGGGLVWAVRIVGGWILQREAMGFGDVTLMAMIGCYAGWQGSLIIFFLAPFAGVVVAVVQFVTTRRKDIAYGPFLCLATLIVIVQWPTIWIGWGRPIFSMGWFLPVALLGSLVMMAILLAIWAFIRSLLFPSA